MLLEETFEGCILSELFKSSQIDIIVHVLQADGGVLAACINAVSLALMDAGVPLKDFLTACTVGYIDNTALLDLNYPEEAHGGVNMIVSLYPKSGGITIIEMFGKCSVDVVKELMDLASVGCQQLARVLEAHARDTAQARAKAQLEHT